MLYTFGDVRTPLSETVSLLEDLLHTELRKLIQKTAQIAVHRNYRTVSLSPEDLCFTLRGEEELCGRVRDFLAWREVRRNVKGSNETATSTNVSGEMVPSLDTTEGQKRPLRFPWDHSVQILDLVPKEVLSFYEDLPVSPLTRALDALDQTGIGEDEASKAERSYFDAVTRNMSPDEYLEYSECRQASFTFKKLKKFREWLQIGQLTDYRLGDDCLELLGFVAWELVQRWAMRALRLQAQAKVIGVKKEGKQMIKGPFHTVPKRTEEQAPALLPTFLLEAYRQQNHQEKNLYYQRFFSPSNYCN